MAIPRAAAVVGRAPPMADRPAGGAMASPETLAAPRKKTIEAVTGDSPALRRYQDVVVGRRSLGALLYYEFCMLMAPIPGALGLVLRRLFWPRLFQSCGRGVLFGAFMVVRQPHRITIGDRVVFSDRCALDARNEASDRAIALGDDVICSDGAMISCRGANITVGSNVGIGPQTILLATDECDISIGDDVAIGPRCFIIGGGNYNYDRLDIPIWKQGSKRDSGVTLKDDIWLGANVSVLSGVTVESGTVAATGAVVTKSMPRNGIIAGVPAKVVKVRGGDAGKSKPGEPEP